MKPNEMPLLPKPAAGQRPIAGCCLLLCLFWWLWAGPLAAYSFPSTVTIPRDNCLTLESWTRLPLTPKPLINQQTTSLTIKGTLLGEQYVKVGFNVIYPGLVEFYLYDPQKGLIWQTSMVVRSPGDYYLQFKRGPLKAGGLYFFEFVFKGTSYGDKFVN